MRSPDPTLNVELRDFVAPIRGSFEGLLARNPQLSDSQEANQHRLQGVRLQLGYITEGRGDTDKGVIYSQEFPVDEWGRMSTTFRIPVPETAPISYDGRLIRVRHWISATVMVKMALDRKLEIPVLVVPVNGHGLYDRPHPLPSHPASPPAPSSGGSAHPIPPGHSPYEPPVTDAPYPRPPAETGGSPFEPPAPPPPHQQPPGPGPVPPGPGWS